MPITTINGGINAVKKGDLITKQVHGTHTPQHTNNYDTQ